MVELNTPQTNTREVKFLLWNTECSGGSGHGNIALLPHILEGLNIHNELEKADIIMLNEFFRWDDYPKFKQALEDADYSVFADSRPTIRNVNEAFIALSNKLLKDMDVLEIIHPDANTCDEIPDLLSVILQHKENTDKKLAIISARIRWYGNVSTAVMKQRLHNFSGLLKHIDELKQKGIENIYLGADFNHARILQEEDTLSEKEIQEVYNGYLQQNYNYHTVKLAFENRNFQVVTPQNEICSVRDENKGWCVNGMKLDHLIVPTSCEVINKEYTFKKGSSHAVLTATIKVFD